MDRREDVLLWRVVMREEGGTVSIGFDGRVRGLEER